MTGRPSFAPICRANVDLPAPPGPMMAMRFTEKIFGLTEPERGLSLTAKTKQHHSRGRFVDQAHCEDAELI